MTTSTKPKVDEKVRPDAFLVVHVDNFRRPFVLDNGYISCFHWPQKAQDYINVLKSSPGMAGFNLAIDPIWFSDKPPMGKEEAIAEKFYDEVCKLAEENMMKTGKLEGSHFAAMQQVIKAWKDMGGK